MGSLKGIIVSLDEQAGAMTRVILLTLKIGFEADMNLDERPRQRIWMP